MINDVTNNQIFSQLNVETSHFLKDTTGHIIDEINNLGKHALVLAEKGDNDPLRENAGDLANALWKTTNNFFRESLTILDQNPLILVVALNVAAFAALYKFTHFFEPAREKISLNPKKEKVRNFIKYVLVLGGSAALINFKLLPLLIPSATAIKPLVSLALVALAVVAGYTLNSRTAAKTAKIVKISEDVITPPKVHSLARILMTRDKKTYYNNTLKSLRGFISRLEKYSDEIKNSLITSECAFARAKSNVWLSIQIGKLANDKCNKIYLDLGLSHKGLSQKQVDALVDLLDQIDALVLSNKEDFRRLDEARQVSKKNKEDLEELN